MVSLNKLSDDKLIELYVNTVQMLKTRNIIGSKNVTGDLGEYLAIQFFNKTPGLPKLKSASPGTKNIDAISSNGERYSIKTITGKNKTTGVFHGLNPPNTGIKDTVRFEYVLIVHLGDDMLLKSIIQLTWDEFITHKKWHSRVQAWNLTVNKTLLNSSKIVY